MGHFSLKQAENENLQVMEKGLTDTGYNLKGVCFLIPWTKRACCNGIYQTEICGAKISCILACFLPFIYLLI